MGTVKLDVGTAVSLNNRGISQNIGLSELTTAYQLLYTSPAGQNGGGCYGGYGGYGGYGYGAYNGIMIKVWGRLVGNNELLIKVIFDNRAFRRWIDGTTGFHVTYRRADPETNPQNNNVVFNVDPPSALTIVTTFDTGGDDS